MKSYREVRQELTGVNETAGQSLPCSSCKTPTEVATLSNLGGWCRACFEHYCDAAFDGQRTAGRSSIAAAKASVRRVA